MSMFQLNLPTHFCSNPGTLTPLDLVVRHVFTEQTMIEKSLTSGDQIPSSGY